MLFGSKNDQLSERSKLSIPHQSILDYYEWQIYWRFNLTWIYIFTLLRHLHAGTRFFRRFKDLYSPCSIVRRYMNVAATYPMTVWSNLLKKGTWSICLIRFLMSTASGRSSV